MFSQSQLNLFIPELDEAKVCCFYNTRQDTVHNTLSQDTSHCTNVFNHKHSLIHPSSLELLVTKLHRKRKNPSSTSFSWITVKIMGAKPHSSVSPLWCHKEKVYLTPFGFMFSSLLPSNRWKKEAESFSRKLKKCWQQHAVVEFSPLWCQPPPTAKCLFHVLKPYCGTNMFLPP